MYIARRVHSAAAESCFWKHGQPPGGGGITRGNVRLNCFRRTSMRAQAEAAVARAAGAPARHGLIVPDRGCDVGLNPGCLWLLWNCPHGFPKQRLPTRRHMRLNRLLALHLKAAAACQAGAPARERSIILKAGSVHFRFARARKPVRIIVRVVPIERVRSTTVHTVCLGGIWRPMVRRPFHVGSSVPHIVISSVKTWDVCSHAFTIVRSPGPCNCVTKPTRLAW